MSDKQWADYQTSVVNNKHKHEALPPAKLKQGAKQSAYLYHATSHKVLDLILRSGLCPRDPSWKMYKKTERTPRWDASKDGILSMSKTPGGAGAIGQCVLLRMEIMNDIMQWGFREIGQTEVRTTILIPSNRLDCTNYGTEDWKRLKQFLKKETDDEVKDYN